MNRIESVFNRKKEETRAALIPFIVAGDPDIPMTEALVRKLAESGADIIELGVPFSDPLADGVTIQAAYQRALRGGVDLPEVFALAERLKGLEKPLVLMTYFNPVLKFSLKGFAQNCERTGIDGVIIPDLPPEEAGSWLREARSVGLVTIFLATPTSTRARIRRVGRLSQGFIYYVSITGVTGARDRLPEGLEEAVKEIKEQTGKPVAVGFGISTPDQAKRIRQFADGVIVGSAIVKIIEENAQDPRLTLRVGDFVSSLAAALKP